MKAVIIVLAHYCCELFPIIDMTKSLGDSIGFKIGKKTMNISMHEKNDQALILAETLPPKLTPCSKYCTIKTI